MNANFEPTFRTLDRTYHAVYNVSGQIYKTFLGDNLQVALDFTAVGKILLTEFFVFLTELSLFFSKFLPLFG